jgi:hypothetical protein
MMRKGEETYNEGQRFGEPIVKRKTPARVVCVKLEYEQNPRRIPATHAEEQHGGTGLIVYDGEEIVGRFTDGVRNWWTEEA